MRPALMRCSSIYTSTVEAHCIRVEERKSAQATYHHSRTEQVPEILQKYCVAQLPKRQTRTKSGTESGERKQFVVLRTGKASGKVARQVGHRQSGKFSSSRALC